VPKLTPQLLVGAETANRCDEADPACRAPARDGSVADRREQLLAKLPVLGERDREVFPARRFRLQHMCPAASEHA